MPARLPPRSDPVNGPTLYDDSALCVVDADAEPLVALALALRLHDFEAADLARRMHVRAAVGLLVETDDVDDADLLHRLGNEVHLRADEVRVFECGAPRQELDRDRAVGGDLVVHQLLHASGEAFWQRVELE